MSTHHQLKTWPGPFSATRAGLKPYEIRKDDRGYQVGDTVTLAEWEPGRSPTADGYLPESAPAVEGHLTGDTAGPFRITYKSTPGTWGLPPDLCVLGLAPVRRPGPDDDGQHPATWHQLTPVAGWTNTRIAREDDDGTLWIDQDPDPYDEENRVGSLVLLHPTQAAELVAFIAGTVAMESARRTTEAALIAAAERTHDLLALHGRIARASTPHRRAGGGAAAITAERLRQREQYSDTNDDRYTDGELPRIAAQILDAYRHHPGPDPWALGEKTEGDPRRRLAIVGALIAAEIDRLDRARARERRETDAAMETLP